MKRSSKRVLKAGSLVLFTKSDSTGDDVLAICKILQDIRIDSIYKEYRQENPQVGDKSYHSGYHDGYHFIKWLVYTKGYAEETDYTEVNLGWHEFVLSAIDGSKI